MLLIVGAVLLFLETILPGLVAGLIGAGCIVTGVAISYLRFDVATGNLILLITLAGLIAGAAIYLRFFPTSRMARVFVSRRQVGNLELDHSSLLHQTGMACTTLRPSGVAIIAGQRVDVVAEGPLVEKGEAVRVIAVEGARIVVRQMASEKPNP